MMSSTFPTVRRNQAALRERSPSHGSSTDGSQEWTSGCHALADKRLRRERSRSTERLSTISNISYHDHPTLEDQQAPPPQHIINFIDVTPKKHEQILARSQRQNQYLTQQCIELYRELRRIKRERRAIDQALQRAENQTQQMGARSGDYNNTPLLHLDVNSLTQEGKQEGCSLECKLTEEEQCFRPMLFSQQSFTFKNETPSESQHWDGEATSSIYPVSSRLQAEDEEFIASLVYAPVHMMTPDIY